MRQNLKSLFSPLLTITILLCGIGLYFVFESSRILAETTYGVDYYFALRQAIWMGAGIVLMGILATVPYKLYFKLAIFMVLGVVFLLIAVLIPGLGTRVNGASRWLGVGSFTFQPAEFAKGALIIYLSAWFSTSEKNRFMAFLTIVGLFVGLLMLEPDMGTAIIITSIAVVMYFIADVHPRWGIPAMLAIFAMGFIVLAQSASYRIKRLMAFYDPTIDPTGVTYHINQIMIAISSGGFFGMGLGASKQKYLYLPEAHTDSIFAIIVEETGIVGGLLLLILFAAQLYYLSKIAVTIKDPFGKLIVCGIFCYFAIQIVVNLLSMVALVPLTGVPLPFISYGGSGVLLSFILMGVAINVAKTGR